MKDYISKEQLNELFFNMRRYNESNAIIFQTCYIYGQKISTILNLHKKDINIDQKLINFNGNEYKLHEDIKKYFTYLETLNMDDYVFVTDMSKGIKYYNQNLNRYLANFIDSMNEKLPWTCPQLRSNDFRRLRGQHLYLDGVDVSVIQDLFNTNLQRTKNIINYNELYTVRFPCTNINTVFKDYTDLNLYYDNNHESSCVFIVCKDNKNIVIGYDVTHEELVLLDNPYCVDLRDYGFDKVFNWTLDTVHSLDLKLSEGMYCYHDGFKIMK